MEMDWSPKMRIEVVAGDVTIEFKALCSTIESLVTNNTNTHVMESTFVLEWEINIQTNRGEKLQYGIFRRRRKNE
jgi:hypothetical protein